jgi:hypothetical protein
MTEAALEVEALIRRWTEAVHAGDLGRFWRLRLDAADVQDLLGQRLGGARRGS